MPEPTCWAILCLLSVFSHHRVHAHPLGSEQFENKHDVLRRADPPWNDLPATTTCAPSVTTACYGYAGTWTIVPLTTPIESNSYGIPTNAPATLMAVRTVTTTTVAGRPTAVTQTVWPPPAVSVKVGQRVRISLVNGMPDEDVTLHFHGVLQANGYASMDGPEMGTQWYGTKRLLVRLS
jgi:FtsP/CotA-like multicopper oxidase with cupredoxin domain